MTFDRCIVQQDKSLIISTSARGKLLLFVYVLSIPVLTSCVLSLEWSCEIRDQCIIDRFDPRKISLGSLRSQLPTRLKFMHFRNFKGTSIGHSIFNHIEDTIANVQIRNSTVLRKIIIPGNVTIKQLTVVQTRLAWIHFQPNDVIEGIWITSSHLQQIPPSLKNLKNLEVIRLQYSYIQHLDLELLIDCRSLDTLDLMHNKIHTITSTLSDGQRRRLFLLDLSNNQLQTVNLEVLAPIGWFVYVDFSHNKINLLVGRFSGDDMRSIKLSNNRLKVLDFCQWEPVPRFTFIYFGSNELSHMPNCLERFATLTYIGFQSNKLNSVSMDVFGAMDNLTTLDLSSNEISRIAFHEDRHPKRLSRLILSKNKVECSHDNDMPFCPLEIEFKSRDKNSDWERNNNSLREQLTIVT
uniref:Uncharacterized protein n=1 Tax=Anopheles arabiensis TaxID=7173 RepID=A0A1I8JU41_ANOAR